MSSRSCVPDIFLGGVPKAGTSSLFSWLGEHPRVLACVPKETFFLMDRGHPQARPTRSVHDQGLDGYAAFYPSYRRGDDRLLLEGTTQYLYQATARKVVASLENEPRAIFVLRRPADRLISSFRYAKNNLGVVPSDMGFSEFLDLASDPTSMTSRLSAQTESLVRLEFEYSRYATYVREWIAVIPRDRIRILLFEHVVDNPRAAVRELCSWLGLDDGGLAASRFQARNQTVVPRSSLLHGVAMRVARLAPSLRTRFGSAAYRRLNARRGSLDEDQIDPAIVARLDQSFAGQVDELRALTGMDFSVWDRH